MKNIQTNIREFRPHIKWILKKLKLRTYDIMVYFCSSTEAKRLRLIPKEAKDWAGGYIWYPNSLIWINTKIVYHGSWMLMGILGHELRHYYQHKTNKFDSPTNWLKYVNVNASAKVFAEYFNDPKEADAFKFEEWISKQFADEVNTGKLKLQQCYEKYTIVIPEKPGLMYTDKNGRKIKA